MKYSNTALKELTKRYKNVLIKCALINATVLVALSGPAMAKGDTSLDTAVKGTDSIINVSQNIEGVGIAIKRSLTIDFGGNTYTGYETSVGSAGTKSQLFQITNKKTTGERYAVTLKNGTFNILPTAPEDADNLIEDLKYELKYRGIREGYEYIPQKQNNVTSVTFGKDSNGTSNINDNDADAGKVINFKNN